ncbi:hypothetical protein PHMEG_00041786 [Phytophthora megakarya]|uniref:MULE transposase domain-containing protein n=1 Tax=Phytophthora megakarya TaxID=4795 RepID=A0A225UB31_9STRA|nr:hypothetical protein PHMEG_00041786 [Phytophthora megakarya]
MPRIGTHSNRREERTTSYYRGYKHTKALGSSRKIVYRCSKFRNGCRGTMKYTVATMGCFSVRPHTCRNAVVAGSIIDVLCVMKAHVDVLAIERIATSARQIWETVRGEFYDDDNQHVVRRRFELQAVRRIHRARNQHFSGDGYGVVEIPPLSLALNETATFFQFDYVSINHANTSKPKRLLAGAHPTLVNLLRYNGTTLFVDATFRLYHVDTNNRASGLFVPVYYMLSTARVESAYWNMIHFISQGTDQPIQPAGIVCEIEGALHNAIQTQFPNTIVVGCLFDMKQA